MSEEKFEEKVLESVEAIEEKVEATETKTETLLKNYDQLDRSTKSIMEDLTKLKKVANDQQANADAFVKTIERFDAQLKRESLAAFGNPIERITRNERLRTLFNALVCRAILGRDERMPERFEKSIKEAQELRRKALGEDASPGSTMIDDELSREMYDTLATFGNAWPTFAVRPMGTKQTKFAVKTVRPVANFILTEGSAISDDANKAGTSVTAEAEVVAVLLLVSEQLLEDSEFDVSADVLNDFAEAYGQRVDHAALNAAGAANATDGGMTGVFQGGTAAAAAAGNTTVETTDFEDWLRCLTTVDPIVLARPGKWWMHPQILVRSLAVKDNNGRPIFLTALEAPSPGAIGSILGRPVIGAFAAPSTNAANAKVAVFGDPNGQVVGMRKTFTFKTSDDFKFDTLQRAFRAHGRVGTKIRRSAAFAMLTLPAA
jgi:HK97 family phage major capsid protein